MRKEQLQNSKWCEPVPLRLLDNYPIKLATIFRIVVWNLNIFLFMEGEETEKKKNSNAYNPFNSDSSLVFLFFFFFKKENLQQKMISIVWMDWVNIRLKTENVYICKPLLFCSPPSATVRHPLVFRHANSHLTLLRHVTDILYFFVHHYSSGMLHL